MTKTALWLVLMMVSGVGATDLPVLSGFDVVDDQSTNTDALEMSQCGNSLPDTNCASGDAAVGVQSTRVHDWGNEDGDVNDAGDYNTSRWAGRAVITSPTTGSGFHSFCFPGTDRICQNINTPRPSQMTVGACLNIDTVPSSGKTRSVLGLLESNSATDYGCMVAIDSSRKLNLFYAGDDNGNCPCGAGYSCQGGKCRASWGDTTADMTLHACTNYTTIPCTTNGQCPDNSCSSTNYYWGCLEVTQNVTSPTQVTCELHVDGATIFSGAAKTITGTVHDMVNGVVGIINGPGTVDGAADVYYDDFILDDVSRVGTGYIARKVPTTSGTSQWALQSCTQPTCMNDYNTSGSSYLLINASSFSNNCVSRSGSTTVREEFTDSTDIVLPPNSPTVTAIETVLVGTTPNTSATRQLYGKLLYGTAHSEIMESCTVDTDCNFGGTCISIDGKLGCAYTVTTTKSTTPAVFHRFAVTSLPVGSGALDSFVNDIGQSVFNGPSNSGIIRAQAMLEYVRVRTPDPIGPETLADHAKNGQDGLRVVACIGDSTLTGVHESGCLDSGELCTQADYCSWDDIAVGGNRAKPVGGCGANNDACKTCKGQRNYFAGGAGLRCPNGDSDCHLTCTSGFCNTPDGPTTVPCNTTTPDCILGSPIGTEAGSCDSAATCVESCPGSSCPAQKVGWCKGLGDSIRADAVIACGQDGDQMSEMYVSRFASILDGNHSSCKSVSGSVGSCGCSSATDCAASGSGTCTNGLCVSPNSDSTKVHCADPAECENGNNCIFPDPDYLITLMGYNEMNPLSGGEAAGDHGFRGMHSPNCETTNNWLPMIGCPTIGGGAWQKAAVDCTKNSECVSALSPDSVCAGWTLNTGVGTDHACWSNNWPTTSTSCSTSISPCAGEGSASNLVCGGFSVLGGPTCNGETTELPGVGTGYCSCTVDGNCAAGYKCVGDSGQGMCRKSCTVDGDCNTDRGLTCVTFSGSIGNGTKVCEGRCTVPCTAMTCTSDNDCWGGSAQAPNRYGNLIDLSWKGTCNPVSGRCYNCGPAVCEREPAPCTCNTDTECGTGGVCDTTLKICTAGDATRVSCRYNYQCAPTRQCLYPGRQLEGNLAYEKLPIRVSKLMQSYIDGQAFSFPPKLLFVPPPNMGGRINSTVIRPDHQCDWRSAGNFQFFNRDWIARLPAEFLGNFPTHHVIDVTTAWEAAKQLSALHSDFTHYAALGSDLIKNEVAIGLNALNVCKTSGGATQKYCVSTGLTWGSQCTDSTTCTGGDICAARPCDGSVANCTGGNGVICGPD